MVLLAYSCSVIFSFLYQFSQKGFLSLRYFYTRSRCDYCAEVIKPYDLLPIISFITLNGRSRCCRQKLQIYYFIGEVLSVIPIFLYSMTNTNIHFVLFLTTFLFLLTMSLYDMHSMTVDLRLVCIYIIITCLFSHIYFWNFLIVFTITHTLYLFMYKLIGYGDIIIFNMLALFLPLKLSFYLFIFTFIIGGLVVILFKLFIKKDIKYIPLIPFIFLSFVTNALFYQEINQFLGGDFY